jgi:DNA-directed RNA polymerase subunit beta'
MIKLNRDLKDFRSLRILLASDDDVVKWSHGEVTEPETINYRTERPEADGLMCEKIFGPTRNFHCYCGKYRQSRYKGIICDKCGVEVTHSKVRRERMGHIGLVVPVVHLWYFHSIPSKLSIILDMKKKDLEAIIYYNTYVVVEIDENDRDKALAQIDTYEEKRENDLKSIREERLNNVSEEQKEELEKLEEDVIDKEKFVIQEEMLKTKYRKEKGQIKKEYHDEVELLRDQVIKMKELIEDMELKSILSDEDNMMLKSAGVTFYEAKIGAEAIQ